MDHPYPVSDRDGHLLGASPTSGGRSWASSAGCTASSPMRPASSRSRRPARDRGRLGRSLTPLLIGLSYGGIRDWGTSGRSPDVRPLSGTEVLAGREHRTLARRRATREDRDERPAFGRGSEVWLMRRIGRLWRELRLDGNPLRRACDRTEVVLLTCLLSALVIVVPLAAMIAGVQAYGAGLRAERAERAAWHQVPAVLLVTAPAPGYARYEEPVPARWTAPDGARQAGQVIAPPGARAGRTVMLWVDASGLACWQAAAAGPGNRPGDLRRGDSRDRHLFCAAVCRRAGLPGALSAAARRVGG